MRADGTSTVTAYCVLSGRGLDARANSSTTYGDPISCPTPASGEATADAVAFTHVEPRGANGTKMGPFVRVYTDRLGREIRTVTESFDGSAQRSGFAGALIAKDTAYNAYGAQILQTQPYFLSTGSSTTTGSNDMGVVKTDYDVLGQLVWQQSPNELANGQATTMAYDVLGRLSSRTDPEYTSNWHYDTYADGSACNKGVGKLCESKTTSGIDRKNYYDSYGRPLSSRTDISNGPSFGSAVGYDPTTGRITSQTYPSGLQVGYAYTSRGYQDRLVLNTAATINPLPATAGGSAGSGASWSAGTLLWQAQVVNAWGKTEQQYFGNGVTGKAVFEAATGRTTDLTAGINGGTTVLNQHYSWDSLNNLTARTDANGDGSGAAVSETFGYADNLNRLTSYTVSGPSIPGYSRNVTLQYNALGMLLSKSDVCWCCRHSFAPA